MEDQGMAGDSPTGVGAVTPELSLGLDMDELILMKENVMMMPLKAWESQLGGVHPLPPDCMSYMIHQAQNG